MTQLTDDELGALLSETFIAHEHLAEPDRARALAAEPRAPRVRRGPVLLAAAASVALVAGGTTYLVTQRGESPPIGGPSRTTSATPSAAPFPPVQPLQLAGVTRKDARAAAKRVIARVAVFAGAHETDASGVPELTGPDQTSSPAHYTVTRSRWWTVSGTTPQAVAHWYAAHPTRGFVSDGGVGSMSGSNSPTIEFVDFHRRGAPDQIVTPFGVTVHLETTTTAAGVGIRATVDSVWSPPRAASSYATDVTSIDVRRTTTRYFRHVRTTQHSWTITDPTQVAEVVTVYNGLQGQPPVILSCPVMRKVVEYRLVLHSPHGDLVANADTGCPAGVSVSRNGRQLPPALADPESLITALDAAR